MNTFKVLNSSHAVETSISEQGAVTFQFDNIFLPDSMSNPAGSQGYVTYEIHPKPNLPENTLVENTAFIYFDYNPAIVTNTSFNTLVMTIPTGTNDISDANQVAIFPNPTDDGFRIEMDGQYDDLIVELLDVTGRVVVVFEYELDEYYKIDELNDGIYMISVRDMETGLVVGYGKVVKE